MLGDGTFLRLCIQFVPEMEAFAKQGGLGTENRTNESELLIIGQSMKNIVDCIQTECVAAMYLSQNKERMTGQQGICVNMKEEGKLYFKAHCARSK